MPKKPNNRIQVNPNTIKVRDLAIKDMISTTGGTARVFPDRKRATKADAAKRKEKYKKPIDIAD